jgi:3-oxosteroid 1-dehydrogenase
VLKLKDPGLAADHMQRLEFDLVVVGSGAGAGAAALAVRALGGSVVIIEKTDRFGGSTALSGGVAWVPNSEVATRAGVRETPDDARAYLDACAGSESPGSSRERRDAFLRSGPEIVAFLQSEGVTFRHVDGYADYHGGEAPGGSPRGWSLIVDPYDLKRLGRWAAKLRLREPEAPIPMTMADLAPLMLKGRTTRSLLAMLRVGLRMAQNRVGRRLVGMGAALQGRMLEAVLRRGAEIWLESKVTDLLVDEGRVTGVSVVRDGRSFDVRARRGVLVVAGGYSHNLGQRRRHQPPSSRPDLSLANPGDEGDAIDLTRRLGAATEMLDLSWWVPVSRNPQGGVLVHTSDLGKPHGLVVDAQARRFVNEITSYVAWGLRYFAHQQETPGPCWFIFDHDFVRKYRFGGFDPLPLQAWLGLGRRSDKFPDAWISPDYLQRAPSLEELADRCGLPREQLSKTVARFNGFAATGVDRDFGRGTNAYHRWCGDPNQKPNQNLGPLSKAPFYAVQIVPGDVGTAGGLVTDAAGRVLDEAGRPLPGLYAAGNSTASLFGRSYPGAGASIAASLVFGTLAARDAMSAAS